jgi:hypothetical protein
MFTPKSDRKLDLIWSPFDNTDEFTAYETDLSIYRIKSKKTRPSNNFKGFI